MNFRQSSWDRKVSTKHTCGEGGLVFAWAWGWVCTLAWGWVCAWAWGGNVKVAGQRVCEHDAHTRARAHVRTSPHCGWHTRTSVMPDCMLYKL